MTVVRLFKPDGTSLEYASVTEAKIDGCVLNFYQQLDTSSVGRKRIFTSLPFLIEEDGVTFE